MQNHKKWKRQNKGGKCVKKLQLLFFLINHNDKEYYLEIKTNIN